MIIGENVNEKNGNICAKIESKVKNITEKYKEFLMSIGHCLFMKTCLFTLVSSGNTFGNICGLFEGFSLKITCMSKSSTSLKVVSNFY